MRKSVVIAALLVAGLGLAFAKGTRAPDITGKATASAKGVPVPHLNGIDAHYNHGKFFYGGPIGLGAQQNHAYWQWWALNDTGTCSAKYVIQDNASGVHAVLASQCNGNVSFEDATTAQGSVTFTTSELPPAGIFSHGSLLIMPDSGGFPWVVLTQNGVNVAKVLAHTNVSPSLTYPIVRAGPRVNNDQYLWVGGPDHNLFGGYIAQAEGWEGAVPNWVSLNAIGVPPRFFTGRDTVGNTANFLANYIGDNRSYVYPDLSPGQYSLGVSPSPQPRITHPGRAYQWDTAGGTDLENASTMPSNGQPRIDYLINTPFDANYNESDAALQSALTRGFTPKTPPTGALLFDSWSRADQEFAHTRHPRLGTLEYKSAGPAQAWSWFQQDNICNYGTSFGQKDVAGIYDRSAIGFCNAVNLVNTSGQNPSVTGNQRVQVTRIAATTNMTGYDGDTSVAFRWDASGHGYVCRFSNPWPVSNASIDCYRIDTTGVLTAVFSTGSVSHDESWTKLAVECNQGAETSGHDCCVFTDGTNRGCFDDSHYSTNKGYGFWGVGNTTARYYDWRVCPVGGGSCTL